VLLNILEKGIYLGGIQLTERTCTDISSRCSVVLVSHSLRPVRADVCALT
jgi:hypothetical protein